MTRLGDIENYNTCVYLSVAASANHYTLVDLR